MKRGFLDQKPKPKPKPKPDPKPPELDPGRRLSDLPPPILTKIVSFLPIDAMARTSSISRHWTDLWIFSPSFDFTHFDNRSSACASFYPCVVDRFLSRLDAAHSTAIRSLRFPVAARDPIDYDALDRWLRFAATRSVEVLTLAPLANAYFRVPIPPSIFNCRRSLTDLNLNGCIVPVSAFIEFPSLKSISFTHVTIGDAELAVLLAGCPRIESLSLSCICEIKNVEIRAPMLRHLMVYEILSLERLEIVVAPELRRFMFCGDPSKVVISERGFPKLDEAVVLSSMRDSFKNRRMWRRFLASIANVRFLSVNSWFLQVIYYACCYE